MVDKDRINRYAAEMADMDFLFTGDENIPVGQIRDGQHRLLRQLACQDPTCPDFGDPDFGEGTCPSEHADPRP